MAEPPSDGQQVAVRLTTRLEERWRVTEAPIQLPTRLSRFGLSEVVNHLLEGQPTRPFDFVLNGELLRGSLAKGMAKHGLSGEDTVVLEYIELLAPPQPEQQATQPDWIAAIAVQSSTLAPLLTGCYDGTAYLYDAAGAVRGTLRGHTGAVKAVRWLTPIAEDGGDTSAVSAGPSDLARAVTASKDHSVRLWQLSADGEGVSGRCQAVSTGHTDAVEALSVSPSAEQFCSAGWDGSICLWSPPKAEGEPPTKRSKSAAGEIAAAEVLEPALRLSGHANCISGLCWSMATLLYSGSWDGSIREWDLTAESASTTFSPQKAVLCLDVSLSSMSVASGHSDHLLRLWDARMRGTTARQALKHRGWVSDVSWSSRNPLHLLSACHDGAVKLWDIRSSVALHELPAHEDKALCVAFSGADQLVSGGADGQLRISRLNAAGADEMDAEP